MNDSGKLDERFREAVGALDAGDVGELERLLAAHPSLVRERLEAPGDWLREVVGGALDGYFRHPYLLWFVAGNPVRNERLPANVPEMARAIIRTAERERVPSLPEQLGYTLGLVCTGRVPRESGVQLGLIDVLVDAGAEPGSGTGALAGGNLAAAGHLIERGGRVTLASAVCLDRTADAERLVAQASEEERQTALAAAALNGNAAGVMMVIGFGVEMDAFGTDFHPHGTALHHAVSSGSLDTVKVLVEARAQLDQRHKIYDGTPLDWAEHLGFAEIAGFLRERGAPS
jgi:peptide-methionine (S)-S-oxide reductase